MEAETRVDWKMIWKEKNKGRGYIQAHPIPGPSSPNSCKQSSSTELSSAVDSPGAAAVPLQAAQTGIPPMSFYDHRVQRKTGRANCSCWEQKTGHGSAELEDSSVSKTGEPEFNP